MTHAHINLDAFNLAPGLTFTDGYEGDSSGRVWVPMQVTRDADTERVWVWAREATNVDEDSLPGPTDTLTRTFMFDFCDPIAVVGFVVNPTDPDDNNWGASAS